jgi:hypothetical protein
VAVAVGWVTSATLSHGLKAVLSRREACLFQEGGEEEVRSGVEGRPAARAERSGARACACGDWPAPSLDFI